MFVDATTLIGGTIIESDICIIGAGAAGITLAKEFLGKNYQVCLLESGDFELDMRTQALNSGENTGLDYFPLDAARVRYFGGTTNHWGRLCRPFSRQDFQKRPWIPFSGWPINLSDLDDYYRRAIEIFSIPFDTWQVGFWEKKSQNSPFGIPEDRVQTRIVQSARIGSFGDAYKDEIESARNIKVYLNSNVVHLHVSASGQEISNVEVKCLTGSQFHAQAKLFVLATGGIENARLLLASNKKIPAGLGNQNDLVGRFFLEHPRFMAGIIQPTYMGQEMAHFYKSHMVESTRISAYLALPEDTQAREQISDVQVRLDPVFDNRYIEATNSKGVESLHDISGVIRQRTGVKDLTEHLRNIVRDIDNIGIAAYRKLRFRRPPIDHIRLYPRIEAAPNRDSRVTLSSGRDVLGQNKAELCWKLSPIDRRSALRTLEIMGSEIGRNGLGRVRIDFSTEDAEWPRDMVGGWHQMGTTRMSSNSTEGVVDKNCRVYGISNLFVAGSSVFPTAGSGTPTYTLVALAIRLADHVKQLLK